MDLDRRFKLSLAKYFYTPFCNTILRLISLIFYMNHVTFYSIFTGFNQFPLKSIFVIVCEQSI